jgi:hypothetical protein
MRRNRTQNKSRRQRGREQGRQMIPHPLPIESFGITHSVRLRFIATAAFAQTTVTFQNLMDAINIALTTVTAAQLFFRVRVRKVEMWATPVIGGAASVQCEFLGSVVGDQGDTKIHTDTSMGIEPAHVVARPAARSGLALFNGSSAQSAFVLTGPAGTVIDVSLTYRGAPGNFTATQNAPVGAIAGAWYYRGLDGLAIGATNFPPVINVSGAD